MLPRCWQRNRPLASVWVSDQSLADARSANEQAIHRLRRAWELDEFPTGYEVVRVLEFP